MNFVKTIKIKVKMENDQWRNPGKHRKRKNLSEYFGKF